jgi:hypothetical protein
VNSMVAELRELYDAVYSRIKKEYQSAL